MQNMEAEMMGRAVVETVRFRLLAGVEVADFTRMAQNGAEVLATLPGFRSRLLSETDGSWQDVIQWASIEHAQAAMSVVMAHPDFAGFMAAIDPASIEMSHRTLHLSQP